MGWEKVRKVDGETTIAQGLCVTDDSAGYDAACKRVMSEKATLARIMKSCLEEYKDCDVNDIAEKCIEGQPQVSAIPVLPDEGGTIISGMDTTDKTVHEGTVTYDIRFRTIVPGTGERIALIINVEAQDLWNAFHKSCYAKISSFYRKVPWECAEQNCRFLSFSV